MAPDAGAVVPCLESCVRRIPDMKTVPRRVYSTARRGRRTAWGEILLVPVQPLSCSIPPYASEYVPSDSLWQDVIILILLFHQIRQEPPIL